jgi:hypothetical protein
VEYEIARGLRGLGGIIKCYLKFTKYIANEKQKNPIIKTKVKS